MNTEKKMRRLFEILVELERDYDIDAAGALGQYLVEEVGWEFQCTTYEYLGWEDYGCEGFSDVPIITQSVTLSLNYVVVREFQLVYEWGNRYSDSGDRWSRNWDDAQVEESLEEILEAIGVEIPEPDFPSPEELRLQR